MNTPIHLLDLGTPVDSGVLNALLKSQGKSELIRGVLQVLRDSALDSSAEAAGMIGKSDAVVHAQLGRYNGLADILVDLFAKTAPAENLKQEEDMLRDVPTS